MKEPTRQQIKEAFNKTIERWEKIYKNVCYFNESECTLCLLESPDGEHYVCSESCPIRLYIGERGCHGTPYSEFFRYRTPENALAELNFLRKVYIWWVEGEQWKDMKKQWVEANKEEKKEEWVDVTEKLTTRIYEKCDGFAINFFNGDLNVAFIDMDGIYIRSESGAYGTYKVKIGEEAFRILKKT